MTSLAKRGAARNNARALFGLGLIAFGAWAYSRHSAGDLMTPGAAREDLKPAHQTRKQRAIAALTLASIAAVLVSLFLLLFTAEGSSVKPIYLAFFLTVAVCGFVPLLGTLTERPSRATLGASLCGGALVAGALLLVQADAEQSNKQEAMQQQLASEKQNFILSLTTRGDLSGFTFSGRDLSNSFLGGLQFTKAIFSGADLRGSSFTCAKMSGAIFSPTLPRGNEINQYGSLLREATLGATDFAGADLSNAAMRELDLSTSNLDFTTLASASISGSQLPQSLLNVDADGANLSGSTVGRARWYNVSLRGANLSGAKLVDAELGGTDLPSAVYNEDQYGPVDLRGADLTSTDLSGAELSGAVLTGAIADDKTRWPSGFDPIAAGVNAAGSSSSQRLIPLPDPGCPK